MKLFNIYFFFNYVIKEGNFNVYLINFLVKYYNNNKNNFIIYKFNN